MAEVILEIASSPWALLALLALCVIDGFFPPVPSESVVIAMSSFAIQGQGPSLWLLVPIAAAGAFIGDLIAYLIGSRIAVHRLRVFHGPRGRRTLAWAQRAIAQRGGTFILAARYIPIGRVAVNMSAGALGFGFRRFAGYAAVASVMWSAYSVALGAGAGALLLGRPILGAAVGVVLGVGAGMLIEVLMRRFGRSARPADPELEHDQPQPVS